ncbi:5-formyltetrahydrofolate cyclo-ligase [Apilactobacillus kunkeei]|uniref:5-formyltetrahydrofolate cyclo-ligase n=1 Tax=Apilactobacillus kunkeei TaxID=148814 RepID=UPI0040343846
MDKSAVRSEILDKLKNLDNREDVQYLYNQLFEIDEWVAATSIGVTISTDIEIDTSPIIKKALFDNKKVYVPKVINKRDMDFIEYNHETKFSVNKMGISEPIDGRVVDVNDIDLLIVPGMAFDMTNNNRLGYGGGYYDRILVDYPGNTVAIADRIRMYEKSIWKVDEFDQQVETIIHSNFK